MLLVPLVKSPTTRLSLLLAAAWCSECKLQPPAASELIRQGDGDAVFTSPRSLSRTHYQTRAAGETVKIYVRAAAL